MHFLIIGAGSIGERHLRNFLRVGGVRCSIAEVNDNTRARIQHDYKVEAVYSDYRDADLKSFDGVVVCVPTNLHIPIASELIEAGNNILLEKPLSASLDGIDAMKQLRDDAGVVVSVAFTFRSDPIYQEIKQWADNADLGPIRVVNCYYGQYWPRMRKDYPPQYAQRRETGGGAIPDHLVHVVNFLEWVLGPPVEVAAKQWKLKLEDIATEDTGHLVMRFPGGQVAYLGICLFQRDNNFRLQLIADEGTMQLRHDSETLDCYFDEAERWKPGKTRRIDRDEVFYRQAQHFIECIQGKAEPLCTVEEAEQTLRTILTALESSDGDGRFLPIKRE